NSSICTAISSCKAYIAKLLTKEVLIDEHKLRTIIIGAAAGYSALLLKIPKVQTEVGTTRLN
ncbi:Hypothetical protein FKW44_007954, partial [Caligus rogercresseyi]